MEVHGSFHFQWKYKLPLLQSITASTNIFRGIFHGLPYTHTYIRQPTSTSIKNSPAASTRPTLTLTLSWSYLHGSWPTSNFHGVMEVHGSSLLLSWKLELLARKLAYFQLSWKLVESSMEVDEVTE